MRCQRSIANGNGRHPRLLDDAELDHFTLLFCGGRRGEEIYQEL